MTENIGNEDFCGVFPVFQTPFNNDLSIDFETLESEIQWLYGNGVQGIVMAMVSEVLRLSSEERDQLATFSCKIGSPRGGVIISVGAESTSTAVRHAKHAFDVGAAAVMAIPPTTTSSGDAELMKYYEAIINAINIPLIIQDASGYVGAPMSLVMQSSLLEKFGDRIMYKPEAVPIGPRLSLLRDLTNGQAHIFEGSGGISLVDSFHRGIKATMPGADLCWALVALWKALESNDETRINAINGPLTSIISLQNSLDAFLAVEKYLLVKQQIFKNELIRGPVSYVLDNETRSEVDRLFELLIKAVA